jgi:hypothetical protein
LAHVGAVEPQRSHVTPIPALSGPKTVATRRGKFIKMTERDSIPDDVPVADAVEQNRLVTEPSDLQSVDPDERVPIDDGAAPLESNEFDWQEQRQVVEDADTDEFR